MIENKIKELSESIPVPDSLSPEQIEKRLSEHEPKKTATLHRIQKPYMVAAACLLVFAISGSILWKMGTISPQEETNETPAITKQTALGYDDYYKIIDDYHSKQEELSYKIFNTSDIPEEITSSDSVVSSDGMNAVASENSGDYTKTNVQVDGVDEGDIVKTDGTYIYSCVEDAMGISIRITKADGANSQNVSSINIDQFSLYEFYIDGGYLTAVGKDWNLEQTEEQRTTVVVYDISDVASPVFLGKRTQSGNYETSRKNGKYLYTISRMYVDSSYEKKRKETYIPNIDDVLVPESNMHRPKDLSSCIFLVITALDTTKPEKHCDSLAILSDGETYYVSEKNIYNVASLTGARNTTSISKFSYHEGKLDYVCETSVRAQVLNQFSLDEHNGYLRFVGTTRHLGGSTSNGLYILDEKLNSVGKVSNLAANERIYSSRFMGDYAYFVTYRETDPLFAVDISNPKDPVVLDKLKIPGFSEYLHPYGDGLLLGIGQDLSDGDQHVKLSMFDISSPSDLKELNTKLLERNTYSLAASNHKAMLVDPTRNVIGFALRDYTDSEPKYVLYRYTDKGFECIATLTTPGMGFESTRGLFVGDYFYLVDAGNAYGIHTYNAKTLEKVGEVTY